MGNLSPYSHITHHWTTPVTPHIRQTHRESILPLFAELTLFTISILSKESIGTQIPTNSFMGEFQRRKHPIRSQIQIMFRYFLEYFFFRFVFFLNELALLSYQILDSHLLRVESC